MAPVAPRAGGWLGPPLLLGGVLLVVVLVALRAQGAASSRPPAGAGLAARTAAQDARETSPSRGGTTAPRPGAEARPDTVGETFRSPTAGELANLSYQREFFDYDAGGRRDPFTPLLDIDTGLEGPRFDELVLTGIFQGEDGTGMVVVEDSKRKGYFLKPGDVVGKATLVEIGTDEATFDVRDFGISRRDTLKLQRPQETS